MKFRGVLKDPSALRAFMNIGTGIAKLSKSCVVQFTPQHLIFIVSEDDAGTTHPYIWCELPIQYYFAEYTFEGASKEHNSMYLEFELDPFAKSIATLKQNGKLLKIKLMNKETPCLSLVVEQDSSENVPQRECTHDIPIEIIPRKFWCDYQEPEVIDYHVSINFPNLKSIKKMIECMKNVSLRITLIANKTGRLTIQAKSDLVTISVHYSDLAIQSFNVGSAATTLNTSEEGNVSATIDARKFLHFLSAMHVTNYRATCSIVQSQMVRLEIAESETMTIQCYLMEFNE